MIAMTRSYVRVDRRCGYLVLAAFYAFERLFS